MTTTYGIVGCGMMGREHLANIALMEDAVASVIYEPDPDMAAAAVAVAPQASLAGNVDALLAHDRRVEFSRNWFDPATARFIARQGRTEAGA